MHAVAVEDSRLLHSIPAARVALIERIARSAGSSAVRRQLSQRFVRSYYHGVAEEDLAARNPRQLSRAALAHLAVCHAAFAESLAGARVQSADRHRRLREPAHARAHGHRRHALPRRLPRHGVRPRRAGRAPHRAPGATGAAGPARAPAGHRRQRGRPDARGVLAALRNRPHHRSSATAASCSRTSRPRSPTCASRCATGRRCASACAPSSAAWRTTRHPCPRRR